MVRIAVSEIREAGGELHGTILTEGRAASGGLAEVFAPGSVTWPANGIAILTEHRGKPETRAFPHRAPNGELQVRARATEAIRAAIGQGKTYMSVEFHGVETRTTLGGVREILSAYVNAAALVSNPEYDTTRAELRSRRRRVWL
ncbi:MAG: hypothetical protein OXH15_11705 [Gammaproteobacteria bacterium]|nr:hypothetical protein [Gammaproteobacteria bacterium]